MSAPSLIVLGRRVPPLMRIGAFGAEVLDLSRATSYRIAEADDWPTVGPPTSRFVIVPALLTRLGIPFEVETEGPDEAV